MSAAGVYKGLWLELKAKKRIAVALTGTMTRNQMMRAISKEKDEDPLKDPLTKIKCTPGTKAHTFILELVPIATSTNEAKKILNSLGI